MTRVARSLVLALALLAAGPAMASTRGDEPGTSVEMPYLMAPLSADGKLVAYAYISSKIVATSPSKAIDVRSKTPFIQDVFVRDVNRLTIGTRGDPLKIDSPALASRFLRDVRQVMGSGTVAGIRIGPIQIAIVRPGS